jgi:hypothetical protein
MTPEQILAMGQQGVDRVFAASESAFSHIYEANADLNKTRFSIAQAETQDRQHTEELTLKRQMHEDDLEFRKAEAKANRENSMAIARLNAASRGVRAPRVRSANTMVNAPHLESAIASAGSKLHAINAELAKNDVSEDRRATLTSEHSEALRGLQALEAARGTLETDYGKVQLRLADADIIGESARILTEKAAVAEAAGASTLEKQAAQMRLADARSSLLDTAEAARRDFSVKAVGTIQKTILAPLNANAKILDYEHKALSEVLKTLPPENPFTGMFDKDVDEIDPIERGQAEQRQKVIAKISENRAALGVLDLQRARINANGASSLKALFESGRAVDPVVPDLGTVSAPPAPRTLRGAGKSDAFTEPALPSGASGASSDLVGGDPGARGEKGPEGAPAPEPDPAAWTGPTINVSGGMNYADGDHVWAVTENDDGDMTPVKARVRVSPNLQGRQAHLDGADSANVKFMTKFVDLDAAMEAGVTAASSNPMTNMIAPALSRIRDAEVIKRAEASKGRVATNPVRDRQNAPLAIPLSEDPSDPYRSQAVFPDVGYGRDAWERMVDTGKRLEELSKTTGLGDQHPRHVAAADAFRAKFEASGALLPPAFAEYLSELRLKTADVLTPEEAISNATIAAGPKKEDAGALYIASMTKSVEAVRAAIKESPLNQQQKDMALKHYIPRLSAQYKQAWYAHEGSKDSAGQPAESPERQFIIDTFNPTVHVDGKPLLNPRNNTPAGIKDWREVKRLNDAEAASNLKLKTMAAAELLRTRVQEKRDEAEALGVDINRVMLSEIADAPNYDALERELSRQRDGSVFAHGHNPAPFGVGVRAEWRGADYKLSEEGRGKYKDALLKRGEERQWTDAALLKEVEDFISLHVPVTFNGREISTAREPYISKESGEPSAQQTRAEDAASDIQTYLKDLSARAVSKDQGKSAAAKRELRELHAEATAAYYDWKLHPDH